MSPLEFQLMYSCFICMWHCSSSLVCVCVSVSGGFCQYSWGLGFNVMLLSPDLILRLSTPNFYHPHYKKQRRGCGGGMVQLVCDFMAQLCHSNKVMTVTNPHEH